MDITSKIAIDMLSLFDGCLHFVGKCFDENWRKIKNEGYEENVELVDLVKRFPTSIWSHKSASIQPRTK